MVKVLSSAIEAWRFVSVGTGRKEGADEFLRTFVPLGRDASRRLARAASEGFKDLMGVLWDPSRVGSEMDAVEVLRDVATEAVRDGWRIVVVPKPSHMDWGWPHALGDARRFSGFGEGRPRPKMAIAWPAHLEPDRAVMAHEIAHVLQGSSDQDRLRGAYSRMGWSLAESTVRLPRELSLVDNPDGPHNGRWRFELPGHAAHPGMVSDGGKTRLGTVTPVLVTQRGPSQRPRGGTEFQQDPPRVLHVFEDGTFCVATGDLAHTYHPNEHLAWILHSEVLDGPKPPVGARGGRISAPQYKNRCVRRTWTPGSP